MRRSPVFGILVSLALLGGPVAGSVVHASSLPTVTTGSASDRTGSSATLNGSANPNGGSTIGWLRYATTSPGTCNDSFGNRAPLVAGSDLGAGATAQAFAEAITGLTPGTTYYYCALAQNSMGTAYGSVLSFLSPTPPTATSSAASSVANTSAMLNGTGNPNGSTTTGWFRYATTNPGTCNDTFGTRAPIGGISLGSGTSAQSFSAALTGLTPGTTYNYCAIAQNPAGTGFGTVLSFSTAAPTVTGKPTGVAVVPGNGEVTVSWTAPSDTGGASIDGYTVAAVQDGSKTCPWSSGPLSCTVTGLTNGHPYTFIVTAHNVAGPGPASDPSGSVTPRTVPGKPTGVAGVPGNGEVTVSWTVPSDSGGASIEGYTVAAVGDAGKTCTTATTSCPVTGLANSTAYRFTVTAHNVAGSGAASDPSTAVTPTSDPAVSAPVVTLVAGSSTAGAAIPVTVAWGATSTGSGLSAYQLEESTNGGTNWTPVTLPSATATSVGLALAAGPAHYAFRVSVTDTVGRTSAGATGSSFTLALTQDWARAIKYTRTWARVTTRAANGGTLRTTRTRNATATYVFTGRQIAYVASLARKYGNVKVYVDNRLVANPDLTSARTVYQRIVLVRSFAIAGRHTLKLVGQATRSRPTIDLDAFVVLT